MHDEGRIRRTETRNEGEKLMHLNTPRRESDDATKEENT